jgi:hypothetical protein
VPRPYLPSLTVDRQPKPTKPDSSLQAALASRVSRPPGHYGRDVLPGHRGPSGQAAELQLVDLDLDLRSAWRGRLAALDPSVQHARAHTALGGRPPVAASTTSLVTASD